MSNSISQEFKLFSLLRFALPSMIMMVFMSLYTIVDGIFVSRLVGSEALSAINIFKCTNCCWYYAGIRGKRCNCQEIRRR